MLTHILFRKELTGKFYRNESQKQLFDKVAKTIKDEIKEQKGGFLSMLLGTLGATLLGNLLSGKGIIRAGSGNDKGKRIVRAGFAKQLDF